MAMDFDRKGRYRGRVARAWEAVRRKQSTHRSRGLSGAALEQAILGVALADPSLVKVEQAGAS